MIHNEMVNLISGGVSDTRNIWADFGAGAGNFTRALRDLLDDTATIYAIDRDHAALERLQNRWPPGDNTLHVIHADFTQPLNLPPLDGILMANALHFIRNQKVLLSQIAAYLRPGGHFVLVEYDVQTPHSFIPYPVPYQRFEELTFSAGLLYPTRLASRESPSTGMVMYSAMAVSSR